MSATSNRPPKTVASARWELGSLFDWPTWEPATDHELGSRPWRESPSQLVATGRDAFSIAIARGGYKRAWLPSYFCQEVATAIANTGVAVALYADGPHYERPQLNIDALRDGDVVIVVNFFGLRSAADFDFVSARAPAEKAAEIIEDHTHDPCSAWAHDSTAAFCVASLRKLYPLADGGVVWTPQKRELGPAPDLDASLSDAAAMKTAAMKLKRQFLDGEAIDKASFRQPLESAEDQLYRRAISAMRDESARLLASFPLARWRRQRDENHAAFSASLAERLGTSSPLKLHGRDASNAGAVPFSALIEFETGIIRDHYHQAMCREGLFASRLWPLDESRFEIPELDVGLSRRLLSIPIDMRYEPSDLERAAAIIAGIETSS